MIGTTIVIITLGYFINRCMSSRTSVATCKV